VEYLNVDVKAACDSQQESAFGGTNKYVNGYCHTTLSCLILMFLSPQIAVVGGSVQAPRCVVHPSDRNSSVGDSCLEPRGDERQRQSMHTDRATEQDGDRPTDGRTMSGVGRTVGCQGRAAVNRAQFDRQWSDACWLQAAHSPKRPSL